MANPGLDPAELQRTLDVYHQLGCSERATAKQLGIARKTVRNRLFRSKELGQTPSVAPAVDELTALRDEARVLRATLTSIQREDITREAVRQKYFTLLDHEPTPPQWLTKPKPGSGKLGVPTLLASDWHWGESVSPDEIAGVNEFDLEIAHQRAKRMVERTIDLLFGRLNNPSYDGLVLALGGDMVCGTIHEELVANAIPIMPQVLSLYDALVGVIDALLGHFDALFIPAVTGNHGRTTRKPVAKDRTATNYDWLTYQLLERRYRKDKRVVFSIPDGPDCHYRIYNQRYLLTHGDQFRGGDGMIGPLGPIARGAHKKASRNAALDMDFDTMVCGHFHQLMQLPSLIVNGSLKGYDEYAFQGNFRWERPAQGLWITHPTEGITFQMPVYLDEQRTHDASDWVSIKQ